MDMINKNKMQLWLFPLVFFLWILVKLGNLGITVIALLLNLSKDILAKISKIFTRDFYYAVKESKDSYYKVRESEDSHYNLSLSTSKKPKKTLKPKKSSAKKYFTESPLLKALAIIFSAKV